MEWSFLAFLAILFQDPGICLETSFSCWWDAFLSFELPSPWCCFQLDFLFFCRVDFQSVFPSVPSDCRPCLLSRCQLSSLPSARLSMGGPGSISLGADTFVSYCFLAMPRPFMLTPSLSLVKLLFDSPSSPFLPRQIIVVKDKMKCLSTVCRLSCSFPSCRLTDPPLLWRFLVWIELAHVWTKLISQRGKKIDPLGDFRA